MLKLAKKITVFDEERIKEELARRLGELGRNPTFRECVKIAMKFEDELAKNGILDKARDTGSRYNALVCNVLNCKRGRYTNAKYIEKNGSSQDKKLYNEENSYSICRDLKARIERKKLEKSPDQTRICSVCGKEKHITEFYMNGRSSSAMCKDCEKERKRKMQQQIILGKNEDVNLVSSAVSEIRVNLEAKKNEIINLFVVWDETLKTADKSAKLDLVAQLSDLCSTIQHLQEDIIDG